MGAGDGIIGGKRKNPVDRSFELSPDAPARLGHASEDSRFVQPNRNARVLHARISRQVLFEPEYLRDGSHAPGRRQSQRGVHEVAVAVGRSGRGRNRVLQKGDARASPVAVFAAAGDRRVAEKRQSVQDERKHRPVRHGSVVVRRNVEIALARQVRELQNQSESDQRGDRWSRRIHAGRHGHLRLKKKKKTTTATKNVTTALLLFNLTNK